MTPPPTSDASAAGFPADGSAPATRRGWFAFGSTRLRGLPFEFWLLQLYLFISVSAIDEEWPSIGALRLSAITGLAVLLALIGRVLLQYLVPSARAAIARERAVHGLFSAPGAYWLLLFFVAGWLSWIWAYDPGLALSAQADNAMRVALFFVATTLLSTRRQFLLTVLVLTAGYGFFLLRSFTEYLFGRYDFAMGVVRMVGAGTEYADPNSFAATIVYGIPMIVWAVVNTRSAILRVCGVAYVLLASVCVVYTHSRSGIVLLTVALLWALLSLPGRGPKIVLGLVLAALGVWLAGTQTKAEMDRFAGILSPRTYTHEESARGRIDGYIVSWEIFERRPFLGVGPDNWAIYRARRIDGNKHDPHSLGGQLIATRGLTGTLTFLGYLLAMVLFAFRMRRERRGASEPWVRAVRGFASVVLVTLALLALSGLAAHNLDRAPWYLLPALLVVAVRVPRAAPASEQSSNVGA